MLRRHPLLFYYKSYDQKSSKEKDEKQNRKEIEIFIDENLDSRSEFSE
jgi:hypothetical protein